MDTFNEDGLQYLYSLIEFCCCGRSECKEEDHDHSKCRLIKRHYDPECKLDLLKMKEWRYYASDGPMFYKRMTMHCTICDTATNPWFKPQYEPNIYYPTTKKERLELERMRF